MLNGIYRQFIRGLQKKEIHLSKTYRTSYVESWIKNIRDYSP